PRGLLAVGRVGLDRVAVRVEQLLRFLEQLLGPVGLGVLAGADQVEVRRRREEIRGADRDDRVVDQAVRLIAQRQPVLRLGGAGLLLRLVERPLVERDEALPRLVDELLPELDGLGQDDLFLGGQQGDLADLLEVHPDRVVDADHVGRERLELRRGRLLELVRVELLRPLSRKPGGPRFGVLADDLDRGVVVRVVGEGELRLLVELFLFLFLVDLVEGGAGRPKTGELCLLEVGPAAARTGENGLDELLVEWIDWHFGVPPCLRFYARTGVGRARSRVWSRRRWSDLRFSFINWLSRRSWSIDPRSAACSASVSAEAMYSARSSSERS